MAIVAMTSYADTSMLVRDSAAKELVRPARLERATPCLAYHPRFPEAESNDSVVVWTISWAFQPGCVWPLRCPCANESHKVTSVLSWKPQGFFRVSPI